MSYLEKTALALFHHLDPETAHRGAIFALRTGLVRPKPMATSPLLAVKLAGLSLPNPLGLAAGFDKNGEALNPLSKIGFGFVELGATTPLPQPGNPKPRLFRLVEDRAAINRFGFNNAGMDAMRDRLSQRPKDAIVGLNLGANKQSQDRAVDYQKVLTHCGAFVDFATVNVSSPNTERLRELQGDAALRALLNGVLEARARLARHVPIFLKIAPDLTSAEIDAIAALSMELEIDGIIATNTTLARDNLQSAHRIEKGGLSGRPLFAKSTKVLARFYQNTQGKLPLIGVGGIASADDAYTKIKAGATACQLYTGLVYDGLSLVPKILRGLCDLLEQDGFTSIDDAIGVDAAKWAESSD